MSRQLVADNIKVKNSALNLGVVTASTLVGRGDSGVGPAEEIVLGAGLTMSGNTLSADGGSGEFQIEEI